ncbi:hypothetical protein SLEP1_g27298 [Rubroshorea leprosula]|nr:hypothetical protein SLEP1_g27298 [Rubroshorea leprosula]
MNERVIFMEKLRYLLKGYEHEDLFLLLLEDVGDWRVDVGDWRVVVAGAVQAGRLHYSYDCVFKYKEGRYGKDIYSLITFVIACLTHCIDYAGNAAPDFEKVEVLRGLMKIFPKLYTKVSGILLDWVVRFCSENLNADKSSTDPGMSTSLASPLLFSMKLLSQDMMLARDELVME